MATTHPTVQDVEMTAIIHDDLAERELLSREHVVESTSAAVLPLPGNEPVARTARS
ncbi:hypothetical protein HEP87_55540 [Streptomyces sp. S1D4-11]|nr:hypothetical protein [Streptomyces sp. S1D4-11]QIZ01185.1 hypothetical protein HEP87_55540 [Streptomyces sp. S1D4-11]